MTQPNDQVRQIIKNRPKGGKAPAGAASAAATTNLFTFQDWLFFGTAPNVFVQVGIVPTSSDISISYAVVVLQTPEGLVFSDASVAPNVAQGGWTLNLATDTGIYDIGTYGAQVQAWAFAQAYVDGHPQGQYSDTQDYTVSS